MNELIRMVYEAGWSRELYDILFIMGFLAVMVTFLMTGKKMQIPAIKTAGFVVLLSSIMVVLMYALKWAETGFTRWGGNNFVRIYVYLAACAVPTAYGMKIDRAKLLSMLAFGAPLAFGVGHYGCIFTGCCCGRVVEYGIYNPMYQNLRFPIQIIEATEALIISRCIYCRIKKRNYVPDGKEYPLMLVAYGTSRFLFEFFRVNAKILWGLSTLSFHSLFMVLVGLVWLAVLKKKSKQTP